MLGYLYTGEEAAQIKNVDSWLQKELGITLQNKQEASIVKAIATPDKFIEARGLALVAASEKSALVFTGAYKEFGSLGLPDETAKALALKRAQRSYDDELEIMNIKTPGFDRAIGKIDGDRANLESRGTKDERRAIKAKAVAKYKASKKAQKQGQQLLTQ